MIDQELASLESDIEKQCPVEVEFREGTALHATGTGPQPLIVLAFALGGIAGGFLGAIGQDLWTKGKEMCKRLIQKVRNHPRDENPSAQGEIRVKFTYKKREVEVCIFANQEMLLRLGDKRSNEIIVALWEEVPAHIQTSIEFIDEDRFPKGLVWITRSFRGNEWEITVSPR
jgi:hypothetical protein